MMLRARSKSRSINADDYQVWLKLRKRTTILFVIESLLVGMDFSLTFLTLWLYINTLVKPPTPRVYYSIISAAFLTASLTVSGVVGRFVDKTRHVKLTFLIINSIVIIGNLIYAIPFSPWTLVVGRLLSGFGGPLRSVIAGEIARSYPPEKLSRINSAMGMSYSFGFVIGPAFNFAFKNVSFTVADWRVTFVNMPGIYMSVLFFIANCLSFVMVSDLSKIYDLKKEEVENNLDSHIENCRVEPSFKDESRRIETSFKENSDIILGKNNDEGLEHYSIARHDNLAYLDGTPGNNTSAPLDSMELDKLSFSNFITVNRVTVSAFENRNGRELTVKQNGIRPHNNNNNNGVPNYGCRTTSCHDNHMIDKITSTKGKEEATLNDETAPLVPRTNPIPSVYSTLKKLFSRIDTTLVLCLAFFESYFAVSFDMWIPMLVIETMDWPVEALNWIIFGVGIACTVPCLVLAFVTISDKNMYCMAMSCILSLALMEAIFIILSKYHSNKVFDYIAWSIFCLMYAFLVVMEEVFLVSCLAKMVNSSIQTFADSVRLTMYRLGALVALMTSALIFQWIEIVGCVHITIIIAGFTLMVVRREGFKNPRIIIR